ncbi:MAG: hypothetical protein H6585_06115 [Flavobacteriales bacterium]|nr:hypothetical protein [Flavobacteriales bacterium]MCB9447903.1 hypothetical protein [Flavobacteriales bacterium]
MAKSGKKYVIRQDAGEVPEKDMLKYKNFGKLTYNYQQVSGNIHRKPLYKNRRFFLWLVVAILLALLIWEVAEKESHTANPDGQNIPGVSP